jgi:hypothetical protein
MCAWSLRKKVQILALVTLILLVVAPLPARAQSSTVLGSVQNAQHKPVAATTITLTRNGRHLSTQTDPRGAFRFQDVAPGSYQLRIVEPGFLPYHRLIVVPAREPIAIVLRPTTLPVIGSVTGVARTPFNATPVAQRVFPREAYRDQGQPSTASVLDQTPGALIARPTYLNNAAPLGPVMPLVRGGLPFETPVLLDGAPVSLPSSGTFDLSLIPTYVLGEIEILQGPGDPAGAGGGVGGALNLLTAEPTLPIRGMLEVERDSLGGQFSDLAYDGTLPSGKFAFATMLSIDGSPGPLGDATFSVPTPSGRICCQAIPSSALRKALLLKLRMTPNRSLTVTPSFLAVNLQRDLPGEYGVLFPNETYGALVPSLDSTQFETLRFEQIQARLDRGADGYDARVYGLDLSNTMQSGESGIAGNGDDRERGAGFTWRHQDENSAFSVGLLDSAGTAFQNDPYALPVQPGSGQTTFRLRATATLHPSSLDDLELSAEDGTVRDWAAPQAQKIDSYAWSPSAVRLGYARTLAHQLSVRAAIGASAVPPPLAVLSGALPVMQSYIGFPARSVGYVSDVDQIERASGGDIGVEWRLHGDTTTFSADWYESATHGAYVLELSQQAANALLGRWFNGPSMLNDGVQFSLVQFKPVGMGFIAQMAFPRTYVVGPLPPAFYSNGNLAILPGQNIAGGAFFAPLENDVAPIRVPYAQGYGEISYKWPRGSRLSLGMLYEGSNNAYAQPAFVTFNSNLELSLGPKAKFQISVENLFNAMDNRLPLAYAGMAVPLANGGLGLTNANSLVPRTVRVMLRQSFGGGSIYER